MGNKLQRLKERAFGGGAGGSTPGGDDGKTQEQEAAAGAATTQNAKDVPNSGVSNSANAESAPGHTQVDLCITLITYTVCLVLCSVL